MRTEVEEKDMRSARPTTPLTGSCNERARIPIDTNMPERKGKVGEELVVWGCMPNAFPMRQPCMRRDLGPSRGSSGSSLARGAQLGLLIGPSSPSPFRGRSEAH